jgi:hypothetical protein
MVCAPWFNTNTQKTLPRSLYEQLSTDGQHACRNIVADTDEVGPFANRKTNTACPSARVPACGRLNEPCAALSNRASSWACAAMENGTRGEDAPPQKLAKI